MLARWRDRRVDVKDVAVQLKFGKAEKVAADERCSVNIM